MGRAYREKLRDQKAEKAGWTKVAPGIYVARGWRPYFIGPLTIEQQAQKDHWNQVFEQAKQQAQTNHKDD